MSLAVSAIATSVAAGPVTAARPDADPSAAAARADAVIAAAREYIGRPYRLGTEGPDTLDCSGLVFRAFADAGELAHIGGSRMLAAGYRRWFAARGLFTQHEAELRPGDLVMYGGGKHIGIYLGNRKVLSALVTGVTIHSLDGISVEVSGFLKVDWSGQRDKSQSDIGPAAGTDDDEPEAEVAAVPEEPLNLGLPAYNTFERFAVGTDTLAVNVASGNLVFSHPVAGRPVDNGVFEHALTYNSRSTVDSGLGPGWRMNAMRGLSEQENGDAVFTAGDGSRHIFTQPVTDGTVTTYTRPVTLYASLSRDTSKAPESTLTYADGSVDLFATRGSEGVLARSTDLLGNTIDYSYGPRSQLLKQATDSDGRRVDFEWDRSTPTPRLASISEWVDGEDPALAPGTRTAPAAPRQHRLFYDAEGYLIGWSTRVATSGRCPEVAENRTCLRYEAGRLATISGPTDDLVMRIEYGEATGDVAEIRAKGDSGDGALGATFERTAPDKVRVVRSGPSPVVTRYLLVSDDDPLGRIRSVARDTGTGMAVEQRTVWDAEQPIEPAEVATPAGTVSYSYVTGSMGVVSDVTQRWNPGYGAAAPRELERE